jgi:hypothetical protein
VKAGPKYAALFAARDAAQALNLSVAGFEVAVAAGAHEHGRFVRVLYPVAVFMKGFAGTLGAMLAQGGGTRFGGLGYRYFVSFGIHALHALQQKNAYLALVTLYPI